MHAAAGLVDTSCRPSCIARGSELCEPSSTASSGTGSQALRRSAARLARQPLGGGRTYSTVSPSHSIPKASLFFYRPIFNPSKLDIKYLPCSQHAYNAGASPARRRYTLTHNDVTGSLQLSVGANFNHAQLSHWYLRLLRDEVLADWEFGGVVPTLHVYVHVSGEEFWIATPHLRKFIFEKEMPLVLQSIRYGDKNLLAALPELQEARVLVHFQSNVAELNTVTEWGQLGNEASWPSQGLPAWSLPLAFLLAQLSPALRRGGVLR